MLDKSWDLFYLGMAKYVATRSKDPSTKVGAVIVRPDKTVASLGFNGFPAKMQDRQDLLNNKEEKYSRIIHAEMNAMLHCREEIIKGYIMYCSLLPCDRCLVHAAQAGIIRFVAPEPPQELISRWGSAFARTRAYVAEMGLDLVEYPLEKSKEIQMVTDDLLK